ncbi:cytochrome c-type biogenesis protein [Gemmatimonas aurantiaca]|uniref:cytochrome c-type biogenesis protein n=1 Tax=Gemmatimonas aurantiaca TaxID=173480 RepID=UPI00301C84F9
MILPRVALLVLLAVQPVVPPPGADTVLDRRVRGVAQRLRCPVCQGESIQESPAELAVQMKGVVREQLAEGKSEREVMDYFLAKYGDWILLEPRAEGLNLVVYWVPVIFLAIGGVTLFMAVRKWTRPDAVVANTDTADTEVDAS